MITAELRSPVVRAVLELVTASSAEEQAEILAREGATFLTAGADGVLAVLCEIYGGDHHFVSRLEGMRISLYDARSQLNDPALVAPTLRRFLPFGGPAAPTRPAVRDQSDSNDIQAASIVGAYVSAAVWRVSSIIPLTPLRT